MNLIEQETIVRNGVSVLIDRYLGMVIRNGANPIQNPEGTGINHAYWMLLEMYTKTNAGDESFDMWKACRWLGFIQNEIIAWGCTTVEAERNYSRKLFKPWEK